MATVLCADDDRNLCRILEKALVGAGHRVFAAHDGEQALALLRAESPDLALLSIALPKQDGFQVTQSLRALPAPVGQMPVLLMSSVRVTPKYQQRAEALGVGTLLAKPVRLTHLLQVVSDQLKGVQTSADSTPRRDVARPKGRRKAASRTRKGGSKGAAERGGGKRGDAAGLAGTLDEVAFPALLHELHGLRATGVLLLGAGRKRKAIQFRDGYPVAVKSNLVGECLGNLLVRDGRLGQAELQESLQRMQRGEGLQGQILVAMQVLSEEEISAAIKEQAIQKLLEIFRWPSGRFRFEIGARVKGGNALALDGSPADLILAGVRDGFALGRVDAFLHENADRKVVAARNPFYRFQEIDLTPAERALLESANGRPVSVLARGGEMSRRAVYGLLVTGLLTAEEAGPAESAAAESAPAAPARRADARPEEGPAEAREATGPAATGAGDAEAERSLRAELAAMAERLRGQTYYEMLGVDREADDAALQAAYEERAARMHPDRFHQSSESVRQLAQEVFDLLTRAHETLADPRRRGEYELRLKKGERSEAERRAAEVALDAEVAFQRGEAKLRARDFEGALECFGEALQRQSGEGEYHAHYGWALYLCHPDEEAMVQEAIEHVRRGVKLARDREKPYLYLGRLYKVIGRTAAAEKMFTRAVQIRPDSVESLRELRLINMRRGKAKGLFGRLLRRG